MQNLNLYINCERNAYVEFTHYTNSPLANSVCFVLNLEFLKKANNNKNISAIITTKELKEFVAESKGLVVSDNPKKDFFNIHNKLLKDGLNRLKIEHFIDSSAKIADTVRIKGKVRIGKNVVIEDYTVINENTIIGDNTYIAENVVIGARGMHNTMINGNFIKVEDTGGVHIGKNCEILSGAIIQKSYFSEYTTIGDHTKISVGVKVGHGCIIGERTLIAGSAQLAGYNSIGNDVWIGPSSVLAHGLTIGNNSQIKIGSVVVKNVKDAEEVSGNFAYNHIKRIRNFAKEQR
jgi:UDP-3-O-[3-hydroxymyristoyl] glucosamine N-acyltransferase